MHTKRRSALDKLIGRWPEKPHRFVSSQREWPSSWRSALPSLATAVYHKTTGRIKAGLPWLPYAAIRFLDHTLATSDRVLEIGGGASTAYFTAHARHVTTLEADDAWRREIARMAPLAETRPLDLADPLRGVEVASYDLVLLDAPPREALVIPLLRAMRPGALLLVDNWDWPKFDGVRAQVRPERVLTDFAPYDFAVHSLAILRP